ncbi:DegT/DnrJ/EryC1/StrS family aminotransferase [Candidatus Omnitrophota bacterium]
MKVDVFTLNRQYEEIKDEIQGPVEKVIRSGGFIMGEDVGLFENEFANYCGVKYGVGVNSGTDALFLACLVCGIGQGDEVIVMPYTYIATALAISMTGARPVFVDIEEKTYNIDVSKIEKAITKKTKAILPVHLYGHPADMDPIMEIAKKHKLKVIEDSAQAHGALYKNKKIGSLGDIGCFSFYPTKNLGAFGDGGAIITDKEDVRDQLLLLRDYGRKDRYLHVLKGFNSRLDTLQAAILRVKLKHLDRWNEKRRENAALYTKLFKEKNIDIILPREADYAKDVYHLYPVRVKNREKVMNTLGDKGVRTLIHYPIPIHLQEAYKELGHKKGDFPVSERCCEEILSLPMYPELKSDEIKYVVETLSEVL